jgi:hypothetical protein
VRVSANDLALARALSSRFTARRSWASSALDYPCAGGARGRLGDPSLSHAGAIAIVPTTYGGCVSKLGRLGDPAAFAATPETNWHSAQVSSWWTRGHLGVLCDSACGLTAAEATLPAADASMTLTTPGKKAWAIAAAKIQLRTTREKRPAVCFISPCE